MGSPRRARTMNFHTRQGFARNAGTLGVPPRTLGVAVVTGVEMTSLSACPPHRAQDAERALACALRSGPFDAALRAAIDARRLPLDRLRGRLAERGVQIGVTTLSYWQRGLRRPERPDSLRAVTALEDILGLPEHALTVLLGPRRPRGGATRPAPEFTEIIKAPAKLDQLLAELDSPAAGKLHVVSQYDTVRIGPERELARIETLSVVGSKQEGIDRALVIYTVDPGMDVGAVEIRAGEGCRVGRTRSDEAAGAVAAEMLFDRCLRTNDTQLLTYQVITNTRIESREHVTAFRLPADHYILRVAFDQHALPVDAHRFTARSSSGPESERAELTLDSHRSVHLVANDIGPGAVGIRWVWR